jgi:hypothetical protein
VKVELALPVEAHVEAQQVCDVLAVLGPAQPLHRGRDERLHPDATVANARHGPLLDRGGAEQRLDRRRALARFGAAEALA